ncbi:histidinol-phosphate transaminase [Anaerocolumna xylanovorans]|uniref:Histidinol-phosphate aminotransferase n=1 Tax=Anaerocolumna xylanovorans DSM 12503 TaxID=1121345 RepID=A0A1M7YHK3_9FIRM|nr:histidinol-phosphate transaminase [Anaerocolumna xylanovorans]SHO52135.1 histidinol-phosphate aminotransferase [Anaerocolumna xylanovorans DSM 12503]
MKQWEQYFRKVVPYVPGEQPNKPGMIKLNTNENPYPPSPEVKKAMEEFKMDQLRLYPDPSSTVLTEALGEVYGLKNEQIFVGVGSDDVLATAFLTFFNSTEPILFPDITYSFYEVWAALYNIPFETIPLNEDFTIRKEDYYRKNGGIVIANPNAPTSLNLGLDAVRDILEHNRESVVIVDEAYVEFGGETALPLLKEFENLLIVQTFSKAYSMAGIRIGYAFGAPSLIKALNDVKYSYNSYTMNQPSLCYGAEAVRDQKYHKEILDRIMKTRTWAAESLRGLGFTILDSKTNFFFASHREVPAEVIFNELRKKDIYVRYFKKPGIDNFLRITIGTDEEMKAFIDAVSDIIKEQKAF